MTIALILRMFTFPGIVVHELGHFWICRLRGIPVIQAHFLRFANPPGMIVFELPKSFGSVFLITIGPFLLNSLLCMLICWPTFIRVRVFELGDPLSYVVLWVGLSIGTHAFPSTIDAKLLWDRTLQAVRSLNILAIFSIPLVGLISLSALLPFVLLNYLYSAAIGLGLPELLLKIIQGWLVR